MDIVLFVNISILEDVPESVTNFWIKGGVVFGKAPSLMSDNGSTTT